MKGKTIVAHGIDGKLLPTTCNFAVFDVGTLRV